MLGLKLNHVSKRGQWYPPHWPIRESTGDQRISPYKWPSVRSFDVFFAVSLNRPLKKKQLNFRWFETPWRPTDVTAMQTVELFWWYSLFMCMVVWLFLVHTIWDAVTPNWRHCNANCWAFLMVFTIYVYGCLTVFGAHAFIDGLAQDCSIPIANALGTL